MEDSHQLSEKKWKNQWAFSL